MIDTKVINLYQICQKMALIDCLTLAKLRPSWMLPTMQSLRYFFGQTTMSGIPENPMVDTKT